MHRRRFLGTVGASATLPLAGCQRRRDEPERTETTGFRVRDGGFQANRDGWEELLVRGVNLGMGKPGAFPGEAAITRAEYDRWLAQIGSLHANVLRVYTVHPPAFYEALAAYNERSEEPLYVLHGNWLAAEFIEGDSTAYDDDLTADFDASFETVIDVVHGNATLPERAGYASGTFETDVSSYVLGYIAGIEWEPRFVARTNERYSGGATDGDYVRATRDASAFERWLAERLDAAVAYEDNQYGATRPASFANWPTTDHLDHPEEPLVWEDRASVNPNTVVAGDAFESGLFATYHAYPYYPDFLNFSETYLADGNSYGPYLRALRAANDHPVLVGEFGVPASRGIAHEQPHGFDQGHHTEVEQGRRDAALFETIVDADLAGGIVFSWQDEWFKRTWNTMRYTDPARRPEWLNVQSPEECFGLLSFDPSDAVTLSGTPEEWTGSAELASGPAAPRVALDDGYDAGRSLRRVRATADEAYLSVRVEYEDLGDAADWERMHTLLALDVFPERGNTELPRDIGASHPSGADFVVELGGPDASRVRVASHADRFYYEYGEQGGYLPAAPYASEPDNGVYHPLRMALSYPLTIPTQERDIPFRSFETGRLRYGNADPEAPNYDSLADVHVDAAHDAVELRLPWCLIHVRDPSTATVMGDVWEGGLDASERIQSVGVAALTYRPDGDTATALDGPTNATDALPALDSGAIAAGESRFELTPWDEPAYEERLKESYDILRETYGRHR